MSPEDAFAALEKEFGPQAEVIEDGEQFAVVTGGEVEQADDAPATLCIRKDLAIELWLDSARKALRARRGNKKSGRMIWRMVGGLALDTWHMTVADHLQTQRIAQPRYSATATIQCVRSLSSEKAG